VDAAASGARRARGRMMLQRTAKSCGPDTPTLCQVGGGNSADDGGKKARSPERARRKPLKPLRGECRAFSGVTVVTNARVTYTPRAAAGASGARHSCALCHQRDNNSAKPRTHGAAKMRAYVCLRCLEIELDHARARLDAADWPTTAKSLNVKARSRCCPPSASWRACIDDRQSRELVVAAQSRGNTP
jgi:hypothetical protein